MATSSSAKRDGIVEERSKPSKVVAGSGYTVRKRLPIKCPRRKNDIYVTRKTPFAAQLERCQKLLESGESEIFIHGLGAAVSRAIHLALQIKNKCKGSVDVDVKTSTVNLCDDLIPEVDHVDADWKTRNCSAIHIRVFRPVMPVEVLS